MMKCTTGVRTELKAIFINNSKFYDDMPKEEITQGLTVKKSENPNEWYTQVLQKAELMEYTDVSGCMIYRPNIFHAWEKVQEFFDKEIKKLGVKNAYFPLFIPEKLLTREAEHLEGFAPEVAWVTQGGDTKLNEKLAVRPTSETIMYDAYAKWIRSHRDLPLKLNQWCNVVRWEFKHPTPLLRGREFLWQEGHTVFADQEEAKKEVMQILDIYARVFEELLAVPVIKGKKAECEKFAGADYSLSVETITPTGKAVQAATSHHLGQSFAKAFKIAYLDEDGKEAMPYQNSWGISTRSLGAMILIHGDDKGMVFPPKIAPLQAVIVPILFEKTKEKVLKKAKELEKKLTKKFSVYLDDREHQSPGWKFNEWELKGVCLRIEIGPKDLEKGHAMVVRRDTGKKKAVKFADLAKHASSELEQMQKDMLKKAKEYVCSNTASTDKWKEFEKAIKKGKMVYAPWCGKGNCAGKIQEATTAKSLNIPFESQKLGNKCVKCGKKAEVVGLFAKCY